MGPVMAGPPMGCPCARGGVGTANFVGLLMLMMLQHQHETVWMRSVIGRRVLIMRDESARPLCVFVCVDIHTRAL